MAYGRKQGNGGTQASAIDTGWSTCEPAEKVLTARLFCGSSPPGRGLATLLQANIDNGLFIRRDAVLRAIAAGPRRSATSTEHCNSANRMRVVAMASHGCAREQRANVDAVPHPFNAEGF